MRSERGAALFLVITFVLVLGAVAAVAVVVSRTEVLIAAAYRQGRETLYAAEGAVAIAAQDLAQAAEWDAVLTGAVTGSFTDGAAIGSRQLPGGGTVTLCCGAGTLSDDVQRRAFGGRDWGADTPQWQIFGWGPAAGWLPPGRIDSAVYTVVWVADDPADGDGNPAADSNGILLLHAEGFGPAGSRRLIEAAVRRQTIGTDAAPGPGVRLISWREVRW